MRVLYSDGGTNKQTGESASAFTVHDGTNPQPAEVHSLYIESSENNISEYVAFIAALRYIKSHPIQSETLLIIDSELILKQVIGTPEVAAHNRMRKAVVRSPHIKPLYALAQPLYEELANRNHLIVAHMYRAFSNKADKYVQAAREQKQGVGDASLFPKPPPLPKKGRAAPQPLIYPTTSTNQIANEIKDINDFINIRRRPSRARCPDAAVPTWANIVKGALQRILIAITHEEQHEALLTFMLLPTAYLPVAAPTSRVENHLNAGRPFELKLRKEAEASEERNVRVPKSQEERLADTVHRLAIDRKIKSAMKILQQDAHRPDSSFEEKEVALREKFIPRQRMFSSIPSATTNPFPGSVVTKAVQRMSPNSATCIDGWTKQLLSQAMQIDETIADDIGILCARINDGEMHDDSMNLIRMGRLVAVPKPDGGVRPIVISSFLAKLTGSCVLEMAKVRCSEYQYAIARQRGAERIVHLARKAYEEEMAIIRLDSSNAFNVTPRAIIAEAIADTPDVLRRYFNTMYVPKSDLVVYGPNGQHRIVESEEGVRQGDAASALLFCKVMDIAMRRIKQQHPEVQLWCYMDDITIACSPTNAKQIATDAAGVLNDLGFKVNLDKSAVTGRSAEVIRAIQSATCQSSITVSPTNVPFKMLGAIINEEYEEFAESKMSATEAFMTKLQRIQLHPQLVWTLLRLCGSPKQIYLASTTPPQHSDRILDHFDSAMKKAAESVIGARISDEFLHDPLGAGFHTTR